MERGNPIWYSNSSFLPSFACNWSEIHQQPESSFYRSDFSPPKHLCPSFFEGEQFHAEPIPFGLDCDSKGYNHALTPFHQLNDSHMIDISNMVPSNYELAPGASELPARTKSAKRSRLLATPCPEPHKDASEDDVLLELKKIRLPTVEKLALTIKTLNGQKFSLECDIDAIVMQIKSEIESLNGVPISEQRLLFGGTNLVDFKSIADYDITDGSMLYMVVSLRGG